MKKKACPTISIALILSMLVACFATAQAVSIQPRYIGIYDISTSLSISSAGKTTCRGSVELKSGYSADITVELKQDGSTIKEWTSSGSDLVETGGSYYVMSGHKYTVTTSAVIYDKNDKVVERPSKTTSEKSY